MHRMMAMAVSVVLLSMALTVAAQEGKPAQEAPAAPEAAPAPTGNAEAQSTAASDGEAQAPAAEAEGQPPAEAAASDSAQGDAAATGEMDAGTYDVQLRDLEQRVNELKEQVFRSKARLALLAETVLQGVVAGAQAVILHDNKMGSSFQLVRAVYSLDGAPIFNKADETGEMFEHDQFEVYNGSIVPGEHTLTVNLQYRGNGYGIFSYLKGYRFNINSNYTFTAAEGKLTDLRVVGYEKGGPTAPLEERPQLRFVENLSDSNPAGVGGQQSEEEGGE